jgi:sigma-E factor negative regulatory protein RseB
VTRAWPLLLLALSAPALCADLTERENGLSWLRKMASASRQLNYTGTFVYRYGNNIEASRIVHYVNAAGGEFEKLETLDGPPREVIRTNDQVTCYLPNTRTVLIEKRSARRFPSLLPAQLTSGIAEHYTVRQSGMDRAAGYDCRVVVLTPKDQLRYGHQFCAEASSGLPLRAKTFNEKGALLESFAFTEVTLGGKFDRDKVQSRYAATSKDWRIGRAASPSSEQPGRTGWVLARELPGFRKVTESKRSIAGRGVTVSHLVYSDGLAAVSVFIEPLPKNRPSRSLSHQGAVSIYVRLVEDHMVTALGEAPAETVMRIANSLEYRGAPAK